MTNQEYIKTLTVAGKDVKLGLDDYGQCFFIEYENDEELQTLSLGTYNEYYMEEIYGILDSEYSKLMIKRDLGKTLSDAELRSLEKYQEIFDNEYAGRD